MSKKENLLKGFIKENPIFVSLLGMCPALAVTTYVETAIGMGMLVIFVLIFSNMVISLVKNIIPEEIRIPSYIVIIASFVTIIQMLTNAYAPSLASSLGVFIPLIAVNCIILGRAESFASKNNVIDSMIDGLSMGLGFTFAITVIAFVRELLATGAIAYGVYLPINITGEFRLFPETFGLRFLGMPGGSFLVLGAILAFIAYLKVRQENKQKEVK